MERVLQYWDDLDDLIGACGLLAERLRRIALFTLSALLFLGFCGAAIMLALAKPPMALAIATLLLVRLMYRAVTNPARPRATI